MALVTCGDDCRVSAYEVVYRDDDRDQFEARWTYGHAYYSRNTPGMEDKCGVGYCPACGRWLTFTEDGSPLVGERYDVLEWELEEAERHVERLESPLPVGRDAYGRRNAGGE
jgi:hypothetical protein